MFAFDRSAFAVLAPIALLVIVAWFSNRSTSPAPQQAQRHAQEAGPIAVESRDQTVAANLPSR
jgi:hypothetical protein